MSERLEPVWLIVTNGSRYGSFLYLGKDTRRVLASKNRSALQVTDHTQVTMAQITDVIERFFHHSPHLTRGLADALKKVVGEDDAKKALLRMARGKNTFKRMEWPKHNAKCIHCGSEAA